jgi:adenine-specific DNA-methyltransferase
MPDFKLTEFPTTRYQGSKRKILLWIHDNIRHLDFDTVLDACAGTGSVSYLFKKMGKHVTFNDKLKFNYIIGKALIQNQNVTLSDEDYVNLKAWSLENEPGNFISETFSRIYYPKRENSWLDSINHSIINMNHYVGDVLDYKKAIAYYALFQACLTKRPYNLFHRKNLSMRNKKVERNFGNKTTWEKSFDLHFQKFRNEINSLIFDSKTECRSLNQSVFEIEGNYDLVYLDPPYVRPATEKNETSNYLQCYHFLEGLAKFDEWPGLIDFASANRRFKEINEDNDFKRDRINQTFEELINKYRNSIIVLSYKKGGVPSIETLVRIMKKYKNRVYTRSQEYVYALNRKNGQNNREVLIIGI